MHQVRA